VLGRVIADADLRDTMSRRADRVPDLAANVARHEAIYAAAIGSVDSA